MAKRNVKWTRSADIQYVGILEYWAKRTKSNAYSKKFLLTNFCQCFFAITSFINSIVKHYCTCRPRSDTESLKI